MKRGGGGVKSPDFILKKMREISRISIGSNVLKPFQNQIQNFRKSTFKKTLFNTFFLKGIPEFDFTLYIFIVATSWKVSWQHASDPYYVLLVWIGMQDASYPQNLYKSYRPPGGYEWNNQFKSYCLTDFSHWWKATL